MAEKPTACWVGFDLGGTKMQATVFNGGFKKLGTKRRKTKGHEGVKAGLERIAETIRQALEEAKITPDKLGGIGVGSPGPLDLDKGIIVETPNLGWKDVHLKEVLEDLFKCPAVVANDVDAGVYGEYRFGAARGAYCVLGVFPGTGIGGGCVYRGQLIRGRSSSCMEIGHMQVLPDGPLCGCGRNGCLEAVASRLAISSAAVAAAYRGDAPHLLQEIGMDISDVRSSAIADAIKAGDKAVEQIVRDAARWLGVGIANAVSLLAPEVVVLGGGLVAAMPDLYLKEVDKAANAHVMPSFQKSFKVVVSELGDDATATGAAALALDTLGGKG